MGDSHFHALPQPTVQVFSEVAQHAHLGIADLQVPFRFLGARIDFRE